MSINLIPLLINGVKNKIRSSSAVARGRAAIPFEEQSATETLSMYGIQLLSLCAVQICSCAAPEVEQLITCLRVEVYLICLCHK